jgi:hypothetical protein
LQTIGLNRAFCQTFAATKLREEPHAQNDSAGRHDS